MRHENDFYATPAWCADIGASIAATYQGRVLDPCAGDGALLRAARKIGLEAIGLELDPARAASAGVQQADALSWSTEWPDAQVVLMNPPFSQWQEFVDRAVLEVLPSTSAVVVLLRINSLAGQKRKGWWRDLGYKYSITLHVLSRRPSFTGGGTDATDYAWVEISSIKGLSGIQWC